MRNGKSSAGASRAEDAYHCSGTTIKSTGPLLLRGPINAPLRCRLNQRLRILPRCMAARGKKVTFYFFMPAAGAAGQAVTREKAECPLFSSGPSGPSGPVRR
jgi:hypothetical protein